MAYYIIFFDHHGKVIDVVKYSENEYEDYISHVNRLKADGSEFQHGYF